MTAAPMDGLTDPQRLMLLSVEYLGPIPVRELVRVTGHDPHVIQRPLWDLQGLALVTCGASGYATTDAGRALAERAVAAVDGGDA